MKVDGAGLAVQIIIEKMAFVGREKWKLLTTAETGWKFFLKTEAVHRKTANQRFSAFQTKTMIGAIMLKLLPLVFAICGSAAGAAIVEGIPEWDNPPKIPELPGLSEPSDEQKELFCALFPVIKVYGYITRDDYITLLKTDFEEIVFYSDMNAMCLRFEREK